MRAVIIATLLALPIASSAQVYTDPNAAEVPEQHAAVAEGVVVTMPRVVIQLGPVRITLPEQTTVRIARILAQ
jgi:hypothetical protein